jgi:hypothetical protein
MSTSAENSFIDEVAPEQIAALATLYDRFAHALDPFAPGRDEAERQFLHDIEKWYDNFPAPKPSLHEFRKAVIVRCRKHLRASDKTSTP